MNCSQLAADWGIYPGMPLAEARGLSAGSQPAGDSTATLACELFHPQADRETLEHLALSCQTYSPLVGLEEVEFPESLLLDITGCEPHFGGEEPLASQLRNELEASAYHSRIAIADTVGAAWAMAHFATSATRPISVIPCGQQASCLRALPIAGLRLQAQIQETLRKLDINTIQQVERLPRSTLPSRFGKELQQRLDQAWGVAPELITPVRPREPLTAVWNFEEPISGRQTLELVAKELLGQILAALQPLRLGLRELQCHFTGALDAFHLTLRLVQPTADQRHLWGLLCLEWERQIIAHGRSQSVPRCLTDGVTAVRLIAADTAPLRVRQTTLFELEPGRREQQAFRQLIDRLSSRLGTMAVLKSQAVPDPQPELACDLQAWSEMNTGASSSVTAWDELLARSRPLRLLTQPQPLQVLATIPDGPPYRMWWGNQQQSVTCISGPERIETGWWRHGDIQRDYYRVEAEGGQQLWIFRCLSSGGWFLHGAYE